MSSMLYLRQVEAIRKYTFMKRVLALAVICLLGLNACKEDNKPALLAGIKKFRAALRTRDSTKVAAFIPQKVSMESYMTSAEIIEAFNTCFEHVNIDELEKNDTVQGIQKVTGQPCLMKYIVGVSEGKLTFMFWMDINPDYVLTAKDEEDGIDLSAYCEHMRWWEFMDTKDGIIAVSMRGAD